MGRVKRGHTFRGVIHEIAAVLFFTFFPAALHADDVIHANAPISSTNASTPPSQPQSGPGGKDVAHAEVIVESCGHGAQGYWLFEPAQPKPQTAPLVIFNHGWIAVDPGVYKAWIDHIVERGNIVVYPLYQESLLTPAKDFTPNAIEAIRGAIRTLQNEPGHVRPQLDKVAIVGHSMGGVISANMAAMWKTSGLPFPRAVMCVEPGKTWGPPSWITIQLADLSQIPPETLLLSVAGDHDQLVQDIDAKRIFNESTRVSPANKNYITLISDDHGKPALNADHLAAVAWGQMGQGTNAVNRMTNSIQPETNSTLNALDFYGTWKLFDGLSEAAFYGRNRNYGLGNTPEQRFMGVWSDGVPVKELKVITQ